MPEIPLAGMSAQEAVASFLPPSGERSSTADQLTELASSPDAVVFELESRGVHSRIVQLSAGDLEFLDTVTLLQLLDGTWVRSRSRSGRALEVATAAGWRRFPAETLWRQLSGAAVQVIEELPPGNLWRKVGASILERRRVLLQVVAASVVLIVLALIPPQLTRLMMDRALPDGAGSLVNVLALSVFFVALFRGWMGWFRSAAILYVKTRTESRVNGGFLAHLLGLPFSFLNRRNVGELLQGFAGLNAAQDVLSERVLGAAFDGITAVAYLVVLFAMLPAPAFAVVAAAMVMGALAAYFGGVQARLQKEETDAQVRQRDFLVELLSGAAIVKATGSEDRTLRRWMQRLNAQLFVALRRQRIGLWSESAQELISQALTILILIWGAGFVLRDRLTVGGLLAFQQMSAGFVASIMGLMGAWTTYRVLKPQLAVATEVLATEPGPARIRQRPRVLEGPVVLDRVWFRYDVQAPWIVQDMSLEVQPGEKRWIRGPSGFGKSTILRLMAGIYKPERGTIRISGKTPGDANSLMVYLPQFVQLYGTSLLENLRIFSGGATRKRLMEAAEASGLHTLVSGLPMGYETVLPSSGTTLSGGERQLVALTAVMASDRSLFLLDEGLANVDWLARFWIENSPWFDGKTIIYASHDAAFGADSESGRLDGSTFPA